MNDELVMGRETRPYQIIAQRGRRIADLVAEVKSVIEDRDKRIAELIDDRDKRIAELTADWDGRITGMKSVIADRDKRIADLVAESKSNITRKDNVIADLNVTVESLQRELAEANDNAQRTQQHLIDADAEIEQDQALLKRAVHLLKQFAALDIAQGVDPITQLQQNAGQAIELLDRKVQRKQENSNE